MSTYDYELLDRPAAEYATEIRQDPLRVRRLGGCQLDAILGWAQGQDHAVYDACRREYRRRGGDIGAEPCADCGKILPLEAECYAIDCAIVCPACASGRYGERRSEFAITGTEARAASSADRHLLEALAEVREAESALRRRIAGRWGLGDD